ncbi:MAG: ribonuclease E/G, partial [Alphaproteobacteria bacterium]|nr:ribonuclease E/G [Alphaproteobacteria bacterium]
KFMRMLMPSHAKRVQPYKDSIPLFRKYDVDAQLDSMMSTRVTLKSGGYIIINSTEALVAIDVNSGRSTRERNIEETAVKTNLEAAQEIARQLRLRDLAGLIVIDFIDMEDNRNNRSVERKIKDWLKSDRARIQVGRISHFGLMEMSRQRLRPSLLESSSDPCPTCGGSGIVYSVETAAMRALRALEDEALRGRSTEVSIFVPTLVALYILNQKRSSITSIEGRYGLTILVRSDDTLIAPDFRVERGGDRREPVAQPEPMAADPEDEDDDIEVPDDEDEIQSEAPTKRPPAAARAEGDDEDQPRKRRRRGRRGGRGRRRDAEGNLMPREEDGNDDEESPVEAGSNGGDGEATTATEAKAESSDTEDSDKPARPRRRRGGRGRGRRSERPEGTTSADGDANGDTVDATHEGTAAGGSNGSEPATDVAQDRAPAAESVADAEPVILAAAPETAPAPEPEPARSKPAAEPVAEQPQDPSQPKKRGWWSRALS